MTRTNAQGGSYVFRTTGSDNWSGKSAMTEARRRQIHGKLHSLAIEAEQAGEWSWRRGVALLGCAAIAGGLLWAMVP